jgi:hypothetical protein
VNHTASPVSVPVPLECANDATTPPAAVTAEICAVPNWNSTSVALPPVSYQNMTSGPFVDADGDPAQTNTGSPENVRVVALAPGDIVGHVPMTVGSIVGLAPLPLLLPPVELPPVELLLAPELPVLPPVLLLPLLELFPELLLPLEPLLVLALLPPDPEELLLPLPDPPLSSLPEPDPEVAPPLPPELPLYTPGSVDEPEAHATTRHTPVIPITSDRFMVPPHALPRATCPSWRSEARGRCSRNPNEAINFSDLSAM